MALSRKSSSRDTHQVAKKDQQSTARDGSVVRSLIDGVVIHEMRNIVTQNGLTTEIFRSDWACGQTPMQQTIFVTLRAGAISGWHMHQRQLDRIFVAYGALRMVLYDGREESVSHGAVNVLHLDRARPSLVSIPPGVWHALQALGGECASFVNFFDVLYRHEDPDEWRLPLGTEKIPYDFA
jgi:dTDP-4-dehydrorhamnose 3,5-epimerase